MITVTQTASNIAQKFTVITNKGEWGSAALGRFFRSQPIKAVDTADVVYELTMSATGFQDRIKRVSKVQSEGSTLAVFMQEALGKYSIHIADTIYDVYHTCVGSMCFLSVFQSDKQLALVETSTQTTAHKYLHTVYLLESASSLKNVLIMFVLYYNNWFFSHRFHMSYRTQIETFKIPSSTKVVFDAEWKRNNGF